MYREPKFIPTILPIAEEFCKFFKVDSLWNWKLMPRSCFKGSKKNYRPVSLIFVVNKIFEKLINS